MSGGIKYYQLRKGEDLPSEFCAVRDENGEPSEYTWYVPETDNAKLRELCADIYEMAYYEYPSAFETAFSERMRELGVEVFDD